MKDEKLIHIKFGAGEAIKTKKDLLISQSNLLKLRRTIKRYHLLRQKELIKKEKLKKQIKEMHTFLNKLQKILPGIEFLKILESQGIKKQKDKRKEKKQDSLEIELREIQKKLRELE
jgi:hypothetical protein